MAFSQEAVNFHPLSVAERLLSGFWVAAYAAPDFVWSIKHCLVCAALEDCDRNPVQVANRWRLSDAQTDRHMTSKAIYKPITLCEHVAGAASYQGGMSVEDGADFIVGI